MLFRNSCHFNLRPQQCAITNSKLEDETMLCAISDSTKGKKNEMLCNHLPVGRPFCCTGLVMQLLQVLPL